MKYEIEFHDSSVEAVHKNMGHLELKLDAVLIVTDAQKGWLEEEDHRVPATITVKEASSDNLLTKGILFDGDLKGVPNRNFKGVIPGDLVYTGNIELILSNATGTHCIRGNAVEVSIDLSQLPKHLLNT